MEQILWVQLTEHLHLSCDTEKEVPFESACDTTIGWFQKFDSNSVRIPLWFFLFCVCRMWSLNVE